jgi:hypothetical protein
MAILKNPQKKFSRDARVQEWMGCNLVIQEEPAGRRVWAGPGPLPGLQGTG